MTYRPRLPKPMHAVMLASLLATLRRRVSRGARRVARGSLLLTTGTASHRP
jgi:hypothetical protein